MSPFRVFILRGGNFFLRHIILVITISLGFSFASACKSRTIKTSKSRRYVYDDMILFDLLFESKLSFKFLIGSLLKRELQ